MQDETTMAVIGLKLEPVIAGLIGAALSMKAIAEASVLNRITSMLAASAAAGYLTPAIAEYFTLSNHMQNAVGFFIGLLILNFTAGLIELSAKFAKSPLDAMHDLVGLMFRFRTGNPGKRKRYRSEEDNEVPYEDNYNNNYRGGRFDDH